MPMHNPHPGTEAQWYDCKPSSRMRKRVTVVSLSVSQSVSRSVCTFFILEKAPFSG